MNMRTEQELVALCLALIKGHGGLSAAERKLAKSAPASALKSRDIEATRKAIARGTDPLGEAFSSIRSATERRAAGAVYTPAPIVRSMMTWLASQGMPAASSIQVRARVVSSWPQAKPSPMRSSWPWKWTRWPR